MVLKRIAGAAAVAVMCSGPVFAQEAVKVGVVESLNGPPAITDFGDSYLQGIKLALKDYQAGGGKTKIDLVVYDDEANPQKAVSVVQRLIQNDRVPVVIGTAASGNVLAFAPILQKAEIPLVAGPSIATNITAQFIDQKPSFIFRCSMVEKFQIEAMLDWAAKTFQKIGLVHSTTGYGSVSAKEIEAGMKARGKELVAIEAAAPGVNDLTPQIIRMRDAGAELVLDFHESFELVFRPMARLNYRPKVAGNWGLSSLKVQQIVGPEAIDGTVMGQALDLGNPKTKSFDDRMKAEYGANYRWPVVAALGYDAGQIVFKAIDKVGKSDPKAIRDAIESIDGIKAISNTPARPYSPTDHECLDREDVFLGVWKNGQVVRLDQ
jgi:branched-chain amino acid transport system substrate-binding protein